MPTTEHTDDTDDTDESDESALIEAQISQLDEWRGQRFAHVRALVHQAVPDNTCATTGAIP